MNIKKFIVYFMIAISSVNLLFSETTEEIIISKETAMPGTGFIRYKAELPDNIKLRCERRLPNKPLCEFLKMGKAWKKTDWKHWYLLRELFEHQEKKAKEDIKKFEQEFSEMKNTAKSEAEFIENLADKLLSNL